MLSSAIQFSPGRIIGAVAAAAFAAAVVVQLDGAPPAASSGVAGASMMRMLGDEHAAVDGYLKQEVAARTQADASAAHDFEQMKLAALEEAQPSVRVAQAVTPLREDRPKASVVRVAAKVEPVRATMASEPMQLSAMIDAEAMQAPRPPGLVRGRLRQVASTVERIPSWFNAAAGWVVEAVPVPRMPSLSRHFRV